MTIIQKPKPIDVFYPTPAGGNFNGSDTVLDKATTAYGSDSSKAICSLWVKPSSVSNVRIFNVIDGVGFGVYISFSSGSILAGTDESGGAGDSLLLKTGSTYSTGSWIHILASWDTDFSVGNRLSHLYINDVSDNGTPLYDTGAAFNYPYSTSADWSLGAAASVPGQYLTGDLSQVYFHPGTYMDFSVKANRRKFISATKRPVFLGSDGSKPTSSQPAVFMKGEGTGFNVNSGVSGNFTTSGTLGTPSTTPST